MRWREEIEQEAVDKITNNLNQRHLKDLENCRATLLWTQEVNIDTLDFNAKQMSAENWERVQGIIDHWGSYVLLTELIESLKNKEVN
tara:strand:- start:106 stop:366 length:261 start_codon:yes stop_codon:yes gene_type:complete